MLLISVSQAPFAVGQYECGCYSVSTLDDGIPCSSTKPTCSSEYFEEYCDVGCLWGVCYASGYGLCCKTQFQNYSVSRSDECDDEKHDGCYCDVHARTHLPGANASAAVRAGQSLNGNVLQRSFFDGEEALFVPNRCRQTYGLVYSRDNRHLAQADARSGRLRVTAAGGSL